MPTNIVNPGGVDIIRPNLEISHQNQAILDLDTITTDRLTQLQVVTGQTWQIDPETGTLVTVVEKGDDWKADDGSQMIHPLFDQTNGARLTKWGDKYKLITNAKSSRKKAIQFKGIPENCIGIIFSRDTVDRYPDLNNTVITVGSNDLVSGQYACVTITNNTEDGSAYSYYGGPGGYVILKPYKLDHWWIGNMPTLAPDDHKDISKMRCAVITPNKVMDSDGNSIYVTPDNFIDHKLAVIIYESTVYNQPGGDGWLYYIPANSAIIKNFTVEESIDTYQITLLA